MKLLKEYFAVVEDIAFGNRLAKYKATFTEEELNTEKMAVQESKGSESIIQKIHDIMKKSRQEYKEFILLEDKTLSPARCKAFKKIVNVQKLREKFIDDPQYKQIYLETDNLLNVIDTIIFNINTDILRCYGIAKNKDSFKILPNEMIIEIFDFVDGYINFDYKVTGEN